MARLPAHSRLASARTAGLERRIFSSSRHCHTRHSVGFGAARIPREVPSTPGLGVIFVISVQQNAQRPERPHHLCRRRISHSANAHVTTKTAPAMPNTVRICSMARPHTTRAACRSAVTQKTTDVVPGTPPLRPNARVYVAMPEDALDKKEPVPGSGRRVALAIEVQ